MPYRTFMLPQESDLTQKEALRIALNTLFMLTDKTAPDIYNAYQIRFWFGAEGERYWVILIEAGQYKMAGESYVVEVFSPKGTAKKFEDLGDRGYK